MAPDSAPMATEKDVHRGHRDALAAIFRATPFQVIEWETLEATVGRNWQQRVSEARRQLQKNIENVPRRSADGKRLTGDYVFRPEVLGRDAATFTAEPQRLPLYDGPSSGWQR